MADVRIRHQIIELIDISLKNKEMFEPPCDMFEREDRLYVELELVGLDKDSLKVEINNNILIMYGIKKKVSVGKANYIRAERIFGAFKKIVELPYSVKEIINIVYDKGILKITLSKG